MTGTKKSLHQKKCITRQEYNKANSITRPAAYNTSIKAKSNIKKDHIKIECNEMSDADMNVVNKDDALISSPPQIKRTSDLKSIVGAKKRSPIKNLEKVQKKKMKTTYFHLKEDSFHAHLRFSKMAKANTSNVALHVIKRDALNYFQKLQYNTDVPSDKSNDGSRQSIRLQSPVRTKQTSSALHIPILYNLDSMKLRRYIIEDIMYIKEPEDVLLLVSIDHRDFIYWDKIVREQNNGLATINIRLQTFVQIQATVITNARREDFINGVMDKEELEYHVVGIGGAAISLSFPNCNTSTSIEFKFSQFSQDKDIQLWGTTSNKRNLNRVIKKKQGVARNQLLRVLIDKLYGDHNQILQLCVLQPQLVTDLTNTKSNATPDIDIEALLSAKSHEKNIQELNLFVERQFREAVENSYGTFTSPTSPIIEETKLQEIVSEYRRLLPVHYSIIRSMINANNKLKSKRNWHLQNNYDRMALWQMLSLLRCRNNQLFVWWAMVNTTAKYGSMRSSSSGFSESTFFGYSTHHNTMMTKTKPFRNDPAKKTTTFTSKCRESISSLEEDFILMTMDNNQRGEKRKQQREGCSNTYIVVTQSIAIKPTVTLTENMFYGPLPKTRTAITYTDQAIPSSFNMPFFENVNHVLASVNIITGCKELPRHPASIDYSGDRVSSYASIVMQCYLLQEQRKYLSRDHEFYHIPASMSLTTKELRDKLHGNRTHKGLYNMASTFQSRQVQQWISKKDKLKLCFLPTSKEDETTNIGCATVFMEVLENAGLIVTKRINKKIIIKSHPTSKGKWLFLVGDGLTHVRLGTFIDSINQSLYSYADDYENRQVLSKALQQIVLGIGDLHCGGFAILNSIYYAFYGGFMQVFQNTMG